MGHHGRVGRGRHQLPGHGLAGARVDAVGVDDLCGAAGGSRQQSAGGRLEWDQSPHHVPHHTPPHPPTPLHRTFQTRDFSGAQSRCAVCSVSSVRSTMSKPMPCGLRGPSGMCAASTSTTRSERPPSGQSTVGSRRTMKKCWWMWALRPGASLVPHSGSPPGPAAASSGKSAWVETMPVSFASKPMVPSWYRFQ